MNGTTDDIPEFLRDLNEQQLTAVLHGRRPLTAVEMMVMNPEVTVRSRGVMEKCTFCLQRIVAARRQARQEGRPLRDGDIVPACAQTCPTEAIVFGDLNDPDSRVARLFAHARAYAVLEDLNVRPRLKYLARLRNPLASAAAPHGSSVREAEVQG